MSYLQKRQNPLSHCPTEDVERALAKIVECFGEQWLKLDSGKHPLQLLWGRRDALSTNELFTFGTALIYAEQASKKWLTSQIKLVRGRDENNQRGAIFEILAVGAAAPMQEVIPAPTSQPGYDADIKTKQGTNYRTSLKRYSQSTHERLFRSKAAIAEEKFLKKAHKAQLNALLYIEAKEYPNESAWQTLYSGIESLSFSFKGSKLVDELDEKWLVGLLTLMPNNGETFSQNYTSYSFVLTSPYHKNEQQNFTSKLESAVSNLERHVDSGANHVPIIIMQLPVTASASTLTTWANEYMSSNLTTVLDAVFFLQPYTASNEEDSSSHIAYFISMALSPSFRKQPKKMLQFEFPVGIPTQTAPQWKLISDIGEKHLPNQYVYQKGMHYITAMQDSSGAMTANISRKAPGIQSIAVFTLNGQQLALSGRFGEDLCLIGG